MGCVKSAQPHEMFLVQGPGKIFANLTRPAAATVRTRGRSGFAQYKWSQNPQAMTVLLLQGDDNTLMLDSTVVRCHNHVCIFSRKECGAVQIEDDHALGPKNSSRDSARPRDMRIHTHPLAHKGSCGHQPRTVARLQLCGKHRRLH